MTTESINSVAVFAWRGHLPEDEEVGADPLTRYSADFGEQWAYQATQPVALALVESLRSRGHTVDTPGFDETLWYFSVTLDAQEYDVTVQWIPHGDRRDYFAVEPAIPRGCLAALFLPDVDPVPHCCSPHLRRP